MSRLNVGKTTRGKAVNHEGVAVAEMDATQQLRRTLMTCLLWEDGFYESGKTIADRLAELVPQVQPEVVSKMAIEARSDMHLRHAPLLVVREMARHEASRPFVRATLASIIQRPDELTEFLAIYWGGGDKKQSKDRKLAKSVQRGLADAFGKFNAYSLAKYNRDNPITLRDVLFLCHAKPKGEEQTALYKSLVENKLESPDTWEVELTKGKGKDKKESWTRLLNENKLGAMALIRNLRNMENAGVEQKLVRKALRDMKPNRVLPFRFLAALPYAPQYAGELEAAMLKNLEGHEKIPGTTAILVDVSPSMRVKISANSDITRMDAATGLSILAREVCESARIFAFSSSISEVPAFRGLGLVKAIQQAVPSDGTLLGAAITYLNKQQWDRLIVITDEESQDQVAGPRQNGFMVNVSTSKNGVGFGPWSRIDGWSDRVLDYIRALETVEVVG